MTNRRRLARPLAPTILLLVALTGCSSGAAPEPSSQPSTSPSQNAIDLPATEPGGGAVGGGSSGNTGSGIVNPGGPIDPNDPTAGGQAKLVRPQPGQNNVHPVAPIKLESSVDGRHVLIKVSWYSGIEPCSVLDSVKVERVGSTIEITPMEGTGDGDAVCIDIAVLKATIVDLGEVDAGTWTITAPGDQAPPLELTID